MNACRSEAPLAFMFLLRSNVACNLEYRVPLTLYAAWKTRRDLAATPGKRAASAANTLAQLAFFDGP